MTRAAVRQPMRCFLPLTTLVLSSCGWFAPTPPPPTHVVLLILDTVRADRVGAFGFDKEDPTPHLDARAAQGVTFQRTISQAPWTRPSIGSMLTSRYPRQLGLYEEKNEGLHERFTTLAEVLHDEGFRTVGVTANPNLNRGFGFHQGFDTYVESGSVWQWMKAGKTKTKAAKTGLDPAPERYGQVLSALDAETPAQAARPHFIMVDVMEAHEWRKPEVLRPPFRERFKGHRDGAYLRTLSQLDHDTEAFLQTLLDRPGWSDTLVVMVSDHGEGLHSHPNVPDSRFHGWLLYTSQVWVPWVLWASSDARLPRGTVVEEPVRLLDMMPTLLDLLHIDPPAGMEGTSVAPLLTGGTVDLPEAFVVETRFRGTDKVGAYQGDWLYVHNRDEHKNTRLHALQSFSRAQNGVKTDQGPTHPKALERLQSWVETWERDHPPAAPNPMRGPSRRETEQLEALGYLQ